MVSVPSWFVIRLLQLLRLTVAHRAPQSQSLRTQPAHSGTVSTARWETMQPPSTMIWCLLQQLTMSPPMELLPLNQFQIGSYTKTLTALFKSSHLSQLPLAVLLYFLDPKTCAQRSGILLLLTEPACRPPSQWDVTGLLQIHKPISNSTISHTTSTSLLERRQSLSPLAPK